MTIEETLELEFQRATSLRDNGDLGGARELLEHLAEEYPDAFGVWLVLGDVQTSQSDYEAAERSFTVAISLRPESELASLAMFHTLNHLRRADDAFDEMRRFLTIRPQSPEYRVLLREMDEGLRIREMGEDPPDDE